jgi:hypothetical protein
MQQENQQVDQVHSYLYKSEYSVGCISMQKLTRRPKFSVVPVEVFEKPSCLPHKAVAYSLQKDP